MRMCSRGRVGAVTALAAFAAFLAVAASASAFDAQGSVEQVYVTGLAANAEASLLNKKGATVATQNADPLGGLLFRNVKPGKNYRVSAGSETSAPITVHNHAAAPWDPSVYEQEIPAGGYHYLTTRDGTGEAAGDRRPPADQRRVAATRR